MDFPSITPLRQTAPQPRVADVAGETQARWLSSRLPERVHRGDRVAVAVGSRGIAHVDTIVRATLDVLRDLGTRPFVVAAMGTHGGATPEGQRQLLAGYGITEEKLRLPVRTEMATVRIGTNSWGEPVYWDKNAYEADAVVTISRIKPHTDFRGAYESGIVKMLVIGLGKRDGASQHHRWGYRGLRDMIPESSKVVLEKTRFIAGLAVLENAHEETALLRVLESDHLMQEEPKLLEQARAWMGRLPFEQLDLLVIGEIGKNYSGAGIDPNVVGRLLMEGQPEPASPRITRICALDLSPESHGNGTGVGIADLTTERLLAAIDPAPFRMNNLTSCFLWRSKLPFAFSTDRECIASGIATCWQPRLDALRMAIIPNTLEVDELWVSPALAAEVRTVPGLEPLGDPQSLPLDALGNLDQERLFPRSTRGRRPR